MSILFVTNRWPVPLVGFRSGTAIRMRMLLQGLQAAGSPLHILIFPQSIHPWNEEVESLLREDLLKLWGIKVSEIRVVVRKNRLVSSGGSDIWRAYLRPAVSLYWQEAFEYATGPDQIAGVQSALRDLKPDIVFAHRLESMGLLRRAGLKSQKILFDLDDIEHKAFARSVQQPPVWRMKKLFLLQVPALRRMEQWALRHARCTFVCSDPDAAELTAANPGCRVKVIPNTVPRPKASPVPAGKVVLFIGLLSYDPNRVGAEFLVHEVWSKVMKHHPDAQLWIGGKHAELVRGHDNPPPGVKFLGFVDDLDAVYAATQVVASPIFSGGGTRIKIVEGALRGRPIISTTVGVEGLEFSAGKDEIVLADTAESFADELGKLLGDLERCEHLAARARERALATYDEARIIDLITDEVRALAGA